MSKEIATLAGGCFWCLEAVYDEMRGVDSVESGYMGGKNPNPTYEDVCNGTTGHAEVIQITFDPAVTRYRKPYPRTVHQPVRRRVRPWSLVMEVAARIGERLRDRLREMREHQR